MILYFVPPQAYTKNNWIEFQNSDVAMQPLIGPFPIAPFTTKDSAEADRAWRVGKSVEFGRITPIFVEKERFAVKIRQEG